MPSNAKQSRVVVAEMIDIVTNLLLKRTSDVAMDVTNAVDRFRSLLATPDLDVNAAVDSQSSPDALLAVCVDLIFPHPTHRNSIFDVAGPMQLQLLDCLGLLIAHKPTDVNGSLTRVYHKRRTVVSAAYAVFTAAHHVFRVEILRQFLKRADFDVNNRPPPPHCMSWEYAPLFEVVGYNWPNELHDTDELRMEIIAHPQFDAQSFDLSRWWIYHTMRTDVLLALIAHPTFTPYLAPTSLADFIRVLGGTSFEVAGKMIRGADGVVRILRALLDDERSAVQTLRPFVVETSEIQGRMDRMLFKCERFDIHNFGRHSFHGID